MRNTVMVALLLCSGAPSAAAERKITASNQVEVTVSGDEFTSGEFIYGPTHQQISPTTTSYYFALMGGKDGTDNAEHYGIPGAFSYIGDWRFYEAAYFKGGTPADFRVRDRRITSDRCSSTLGCALKESFVISISPDQLAKFADEEGLAIKVVAKRGASFIIEIPKAEIDAVREVTHGLT
jgi:hypothetical protein